MTDKSKPIVIGILVALILGAMLLVVMSGGGSRTVRPDWPVITTPGR